MTESKAAAELAWQLFQELRKELVESQRLRTQIVGFKITFVSTGIGIIVTNLDKIPAILLVLPAFAAIFFDFLIYSYNYSIKRIGVYCEHFLEPLLRKGYGVPRDVMLWEEFLTKSGAAQQLSRFSSIGFTILVVGVAGLPLFQPFRPLASSVVLAILLSLLIADVLAMNLPRRLRNKEFSRAHHRGKLTPPGQKKHRSDLG